MVAGSPDGVIMVEASANQLPEQDIIEAIDFGYEAACDLIQAQREIMAELGIDLVVEDWLSRDTALENFIGDRAEAPIRIILSKFEQDKNQRNAALDEIKANELNLRSPNSRKKTR